MYNKGQSARIRQALTFILVFANISSGNEGITGNKKRSLKGSSGSYYNALIWLPKFPEFFYGSLTIC